MSKGTSSTDIDESNAEIGTITYPGDFVVHPQFGIGKRWYCNPKRSCRQRKRRDMMNNEKKRKMQLNENWLVRAKTESDSRFKLMEECREAQQKIMLLHLQKALRMSTLYQPRGRGCYHRATNRDLEIRGAGSLLGTEQSGMAAKVGFDLYMSIKQEGIPRLFTCGRPMTLRYALPDREVTQQTKYYTTLPSFQMRMGDGWITVLDAIDDMLMVHSVDWDDRDHEASETDVGFAWVYRWLQVTHDYYTQGCMKTCI
eukprot:scaffold22373_cov78-Cyclotella_meneghiniana.AAC.6